MPPPMLPEKAVPRLAGHVRLRTDPLNGRPLLLYPEGALELEESASAILDLCDGRRSVAEIASILAESYDASREEIVRDIDEFLQVLVTKGLVRIEEQPA